MRAALEGKTETVERSDRVDVCGDQHPRKHCEEFAGAWGKCKCTANDGSTVLMLAASAGDAEIVRDLFSKGAGPSVKSTQAGKTALMLLKEKDFTDIARLLGATAA